MGHARGETTPGLPAALEPAAPHGQGPPSELGHRAGANCGKTVGVQASNGEGGIRTLDGGIHPHNALAGRRLQPLGHFSVRRILPHASERVRPKKKRPLPGCRRERAPQMPEKRGEPALPCSSAPDRRACLRRVIFLPDVRKAASRRWELRVSRPLGPDTVGCGPHCAELDRREDRLSGEIARSLIPVKYNGQPNTSDGVKWALRRRCRYHVRSPGRRGVELRGECLIHAADRARPVFSSRLSRGCGRSARRGGAP
jgi:hypothetical protein